MPPAAHDTPTAFGMGGAGGSFAYGDTATGTAFGLTKNRLTADFNTASQIILDITSTVEEVDAPHRIVRNGPAQGIVAPSTSGPLTRKKRACLSGPRNRGRATRSPAKPRRCRRYLTGRCATGWKTSSA